MRNIAIRFMTTVASVFATFLLIVNQVHAQDYSFHDPLDPKFSTIPGFIAGALKVLVMVALPVITLFIVISGFMFVMARGNAAGIEKAKKNFVFVILGALLILGAWVIATLIGGTVSQVLKG